MQGTVLVTDSSYARDLALAGVRIAYVFEPLVSPDLRDGRLVQVLPEASIEEPGLFAYFPHRSTQAPKLRAFPEVAQSAQR